jgi:hypothetical protein
MVEDDDLRAVFFDAEDFGVEAIITPNASDAFTVTGIFDARPVEPRPLGGAQVGFRDGMQNTGNSPQFRCRTSDVANVKPGRATLAVHGATYSVWEVKPDHTGTSTLILKMA